jgi:hypothetical protein
VRRRKVEENVRRQLMEKSLEAVIEEARMELKMGREPNKSQEGNYYVNVDFNRNQPHPRMEHTYENLNQAVYENMRFHSVLVEAEAEAYEEMHFERLSETYVEMTPVKLVTLM